jgi:hypothetical protein
MARFVKHLKTTVATTVQAAKEKIGLSQREIDDELQEAVSRMDLIESRIATYLQDLRDFLSAFQPASSAAIELSTILAQAGEESPVSAAFQTFSERTAALVQDELLLTANRAVLSDVQGLQEQIDEFKRMRAARHETRLLWSRLRDTLDNAAKSGRPPEEIGQLRVEFEKKTIELRSQTDQIKQRANALWEVQSTMFEQPLQRLVGLLFTFCHQTYENLLPLEASIPPDVMRQDFPPSKV